MDNEKKDNQLQNNNETNNSPKRGLRLVINFLIPVIIVAIAAFFFKYQMDTRPKAKRTPPPRQARLVEVTPLKRTSETPNIYVMGTVIPARRVTLTPEVTGVINAIDPVVVPGGIIQKDQTLFQLDSRDYQTVVKQRQSDLSQALLNLKLESGNQAVARQEYDMLQEVVNDQNNELLLRKPHLEQTQAKYQAAQALLKQAELDVARCTIKAPFNAIINEKYLDIGARVSPSSSLLSITGIDEYWIEVLVPENQLQWIQIPTAEGQTGAQVKIYNAAWKANQFRQGSVIRLLGQLEQQGRMAQLLVSVKDPLCLQNNDSSQPRLLIGSYVRVEISGIQLQNVFRIKRQYLRDGNAVWIMNDQDKLETHPVEILFRSSDDVYIKNDLQQDMRLVTTDLSAPVEGMDLRLEETKQHDPAGENNG